MTRKLNTATDCNIDRLGAGQPTTAKPNANSKPTKKQIAYSARAEAAFKAIEEAANEPIATKTRAPRKAKVAKVQVIAIVEATPAIEAAPQIAIAVVNGIEYTADVLGHMPPTEAARLYFQLAGMAGNAKGDKATELAGYRKAVYGWYVAEYSKAPYLGKSHAA